MSSPNESLDYRALSKIWKQPARSRNDTWKQSRIGPAISSRWILERRRTCEFDLDEGTWSQWRKNSDDKANNSKQLRKQEVRYYCYSNIERLEDF